MWSLCNGLQLKQSVSQPTRSQAAVLAFPCAGAYFRSAYASPTERAYHVATLRLHEVGAHRITGSAEMLCDINFEVQH